MGQEMNSIEWLIKNTDVPFADQELSGLKVMKALIKWEWGMKALYAHSLSVAYLLSRVPKAKELVEMKFKVIEKTVRSPFFLKGSGFITPEIGEQIEKYYQGGVFGNEGLGKEYVPEYA
eukprot:CAMPEP_0170567660 /NCGR_PEP_ID=MMETSP0211-20121228/80625_1 /TAXON_ID=311385 /ORGANISM="Pseudokeronopsis sp., Strain OXSARD2" /LENGTH=118 /DNA_ID=CAMNT_0010889181 /DNA_START=1255 /DNA_END=1607 /DNA_ORIENTATION=+